MKKITSSIGYSLYLLVTVSLILGLLEGALRLGGYVPRWGSFRASFNSEVYPLARDAQGQEIHRTDPRFLSVFQDQSFPARQGGALRVFAIGGSSTFGWGMEKSLDDSYIKVFERDFRKRYPTRAIEASARLVPLPWGSAPSSVASSIPRRPARSTASATMPICAANNVLLTSLTR